MAYWRSLSDRESYVTKTASMPNPTNFREGIQLLDIDTGTKYIVNNGAWVVDKSEYSGNVYNSDGVLVNTSDAYYDTALTAEDIESRYFRQGYVYGAGYTWSNVTSNGIVNIYKGWHKTNLHEWNNLWCGIIRLWISYWCNNLDKWNCIADF